MSEIKFEQEFNLQDPVKALFRKRWSLRKKYMKIIKLERTYFKFTLIPMKKKLALGHSVLQSERLLSQVPTKYYYYYRY